MNFFKKVKYQFWIALLFSIIILLVVVQNGENWFGVNVNTIIINLLSAIIASIIVGIYFDISAKEGFHNEIESLLSINSLVQKSGIKQYHLSWDSIDLTDLIKSSKNIDIYVYYGATLFNDYQSILEEFLNKKGRTLRVFIMHENNKFLEASAALWEVSDNSYSFQKVKEKLQKTLDLFQSMETNLKAQKRLKAKFEVYKVKKHPVNFSFYKFDKELVIVFNKLSHHKTPKPPVIFASKSKVKESLYNRIETDFSALFEKGSEFLEKVRG